MAAESRTVRIHLITSKRYRHGKLFIWSPDRNARRTLELAGHDEVGPYWDVDLQDRDRHLFCFKFLRKVDGKDAYEPDYANRLYSSTDGREIWTHSEGREVIWNRPEKKLLTVHFQQRSDIEPPQMHLWQESSDFATDVEVSSTENGWGQYEFLLYTGIPYRFKFHNDELEESRRWEHSAATRTVILESDRPLWALFPCPLPVGASYSCSKSHSAILWRPNQNAGSA